MGFVALVWPSRTLSSASFTRVIPYGGHLVVQEVSHHNGTATPMVIAEPELFNNSEFRRLVEWRSPSPRQLGPVVTRLTFVGIHGAHLMRQ